MPLLEFIDHRILLVAGVFLLWGVLAVWHHRLRRDLRRSVKALHVSLGSMKRLAEEDREATHLEHQSLSREIASAAASCRAEVEQLRQEVDALRATMEADVNQLADVVVALEARPPQRDPVEPAEVPGKIALFILRSDIEKLRAEVSALQASRGPHVPLPQPQAPARRVKLPRTERVLAALDESRGEGLAGVSQDKTTVN